MNTGRMAVYVASKEAISVHYQAMPYSDFMITLADRLALVGNRGALEEQRGELYFTPSDSLGRQVGSYSYKVIRDEVKEVPETWLEESYRLLRSAIRSLEEQAEDHKLSESRSSEEVK